MKHNDLIPVFDSYNYTTDIWKRYPTSYNINLNFPEKCLAVVHSVKKTPEKTLKLLPILFIKGSMFGDFPSQKILVSKGAIFNYMEQCFDVMTLRKYSKYDYIKIANTSYYRNSNLTVYITSEFIMEQKKVFDLLFPIISKLNIQIISRKKLKELLNGQ